MAKEANWGERGDFRKVTVTLPPDVYDSLVQESARRKSAGDANHLLSAIAREWFAHRQPLLPIERTELAIYRAADLCGRGEWWHFDNLHSLGQKVGETADKILVGLLLDLASRGWVLLTKWSQDAGHYLPVERWQDDNRFFYEGANIRLQVTIPGRRRKEALEAKETPPTEPNGTVNPH
jgi:hypothetical protein